MIKKLKFNIINNTAEYIVKIVFDPNIGKRLWVLNRARGWAPCSPCSSYSDQLKPSPTQYHLTYCRIKRL